MSEDHKHRPNDHLVEPLFGGLGVKGEAQEAEQKEESPQPKRHRTWIRRLLERLGLGAS